MPTEVFPAALCRVASLGFLSWVGDLVELFGPEFLYLKSPTGLVVGICCGRDIPSLGWLALLWPLAPSQQPLSFSPRPALPPVSC